MDAHTGDIFTGQDGRLFHGEKFSQRVSRSDPEPEVGTSTSTLPYGGTGEAQAPSPRRPTGRTRWGSRRTRTKGRGIRPESRQKLPHRKPDQSG